jgi:hypothetical protein
VSCCCSQAIKDPRTPFPNNRLYTVHHFANALAIAATHKCSLIPNALAADVRRKLEELWANFRFRTLEKPEFEGTNRRVLCVPVTDVSQTGRITPQGFHAFLAAQKRFIKGLTYAT